MGMMSRRNKKYKEALKNIEKATKEVKKPAKKETVVVTNEKNGLNKIPNVCKAFNIESISLLQFIDEIIEYVGVYSIIVPGLSIDLSPSIIHST